MPEHIVMTSSAKMPANCWGKYRRVAIVRLTPEYAEAGQRPAMISRRARGVADLIDLGPHHVGVTERCAYQRALAEAEVKAAELNKAMESQMTAGKRITATFNPQAWQRDYAIDVDCEGEDTWDVTDEVLTMGRETALRLRDNRDETDNLRFSANAPKWVRDWSGPFYVEVEDSIADFFSEDGTE